LQRHKRPIDYLPEHPTEAIRQIWIDADIEYILYEIPYWLYMALSHEGAVYNDTVEERRLFIEFYADLLPFIEATNFFNEIEIAEQNDKKPDSHAPRKKILLYGGDYQAVYLSKTEVINPLLVIARFCKTYSIPYVRIELWHFFQAVQYYDGPLKEFIYKDNTHNFYLNLLTLVEAGHLLPSV
jgi:hypothetical protein